MCDKYGPPVLKTKRATTHPRMALTVERGWATVVVAPLNLVVTEAGRDLVAVPITLYIALEFFLQRSRHATRSSGFSSEFLTCTLFCVVASFYYLFSGSFGPKDNVPSKEDAGQTPPQKGLQLPPQKAM